MDDWAAIRQQLRTSWKAAYPVGHQTPERGTWAVPFPLLLDRYARLTLDRSGEHDLWYTDGRVADRTKPISTTGSTALEALERLYQAL